MKQTTLLLEDALKRKRHDDIPRLLHDGECVRDALRNMAPERLRELLECLRDREMWHKTDRPHDRWASDVRLHCLADPDVLYGRKGDGFLTYKNYCDQEEHVWFCHQAICPLILALAIERDDLLLDLLEQGAWIQRSWGTLNIVDIVFRPKSPLRIERRMWLIPQIVKRRPDLLVGCRLVHMLLSTDDDARDAPILKVLLEAKAGVNEAAACSQTPAQHAASRNLPRMLQHLLDAGADLIFSPGQERTMCRQFLRSPLHWVASEVGDNLQAWRATVHVLMTAGGGLWPPVSDLRPDVKAFFDEVYADGSKVLQDELALHLPFARRDLVHIVSFVRGVWWSAQREQVHEETPKHKRTKPDDQEDAPS